MSGPGQELDPLLAGSFARGFYLKARLNYCYMVFLFSNAEF